MTTWYEELAIEASTRGEAIDDLTCTLTTEELKEEFDPGYGFPRGKPFTAWGENWVYFPVTYDGAEWVGSVPRNPCSIATEHLGG